MRWFQMMVVLAISACTNNNNDTFGDDTGNVFDTDTNSESDKNEDTSEIDTGQSLDTDSQETDVVDTDANCYEAWYDADGDMYGGDGASQVFCTVPWPAHWMPSNNDCDDSNPAIHPNAVEVCDHLVNDCYASPIASADYVVGSGPLDCSAFSVDNDGDGHNNGYGGPGWGDDCDDSNPDISPSAPEVCDGVDQNCNIGIDENVPGAPDWYEDADQDGYGSLTGHVFYGPLFGRCSAPTSSPLGPVYYIDNSLDCDDADPTVGSCP